MRNGVAAPFLCKRCALLFLHTCASEIALAFGTIDQNAASSRKTNELVGRVCVRWRVCGRMQFIPPFVAILTVHYLVPGRSEGVAIWPHQAFVFPRSASAGARENLEENEAIINPKRAHSPFGLGAGLCMCALSSICTVLHIVVVGVIG